jgi:hypothetical protein
MHFDMKALRFAPMSFWSSAPKAHVSIFSFDVAAKAGAMNKTDAANPVAAINRIIIGAPYARFRLSMILSENRFPLFGIML